MLEQLKRWQQMGYFVSLDVVSIAGEEGPRQWALIVGTEPINDWQMRGYDLGLRRKVMRFVSTPCDTIEEAIGQAMEVIR